MKRLFLAIMLPDAARQDVRNAQTVLREAMDANGIRWTPPAQLHYTLRFLGDVDEAQISAVEEAAVCAAAQVKPFRLGVGGVGVFPGQRRPQVLWIGATRSVPHFTRLAEYLERELTERDFVPETKLFRPHLTLARAKTADGEEMIAKTLPTLTDANLFQNEISAFDVADFALVHSELKPAGPLYTVLKTFALGAESE